ncbi:hypothetical protein HY024_01480, partial [Candidatus Curtissbacteria bacterium]|nr:hypothetical protein [Candidatus Curtissbacteria bacterium]
GNGNPKTIYDLVQEFGAPNPPTLSQQQQQNDSWNSTWGKYWAKIPTTWSEFYKAKLDFRPVVGDEDLKKIRDGQMCPIPIRNVEVNFVMPEFFRTTAISDQINRLLAPKSAQSYQDHGILSSPTPKSTQNTIPSAVQNFFSYCWKLITNPSSLAKQIQKTTSFMIDPKNFLIKPVLAATQNLDDTSCIKITKNAKSGQAPYCPLPTEEKARLGNAVSCSDQNDNFKLEKDNPNVICTFTFSTPTLLYVINPKDKNDDDSKVCTLDQSTQNYQCNIKVYVIPDFRIPWLSAIWNDTLYSDKNENAPYQNETGRPGIYTFFTPVSLQVF